MNRCCRLIFVLVILCGGVFWEASGFVSRTTTRASRSSVLIPSPRPLHLLNVNKEVPRKRKSAEHSALSHPTGGRHHEKWDNFLIPPIALKPSYQHHDHITALDKTLVLGSVGAFGALLYKFVMASAPGSWRYFLAGGLCAASSHAIPTPIDVIKVCITTCGVHCKESRLRCSLFAIDAFRLANKWTRDLPTNRFFQLDGPL